MMIIWLVGVNTCSRSESVCSWLASGWRFWAGFSLARLGKASAWPHALVAAVYGRRSHCSSVPPWREWCDYKICADRKLKVESQYFVINLGSGERVWSNYGSFWAEDCKNLPFLSLSHVSILILTNTRSYTYKESKSLFTSYVCIPQPPSEPPR